MFAPRKRRGFGHALEVRSVAGVVDVNETDDKEVQLLLQSGRYVFEAEWHLATKPEDLDE